MDVSVGVRFNRHSKHDHAVAWDLHRVNAADIHFCGFPLFNRAAGETPAVIEPVTDGEPLEFDTWRFRKLQSRAASAWIAVLCFAVLGLVWVFL